MKNIKVSVIVPVYNSADLISNTLTSVINQTHKNIEILVINDFSSDNSVDIIKEYIDKDSRVKLFSLTQNSGVAVARNTGLENAEGEYIAFLDSDDSWAKDKIERQLSFMVEHDYKFSFTSYERIDDQGNKKNITAPENVHYRKLLNGNLIGCSTVMIRSDIIKDLSFPLLRKRQDYAFWLKILKSGVVAHGLNENLTFYKVRTRSLSSNKFKLIKYQWQLFRKVEKMNLLCAFYYFSRSIITSFIK